MRGDGWAYGAWWKCGDVQLDNKEARRTGGEVEPDFDPPIKPCNWVESEGPSPAGCYGARGSAHPLRLSNIGMKKWTVFGVREMVSSSVSGALHAFPFSRTMSASG